MSTRLSFASVALLVFLVGCTDGKPLAPAASDEPSFPPAITPYEPNIDPADFVTTIDNPYLPLIPGSKRVYEGRSEGERERVVVTVTDKTKEILGVSCTVVLDVVSVDGELVEKTFDWLAQDRFGNVWYFGEDSKEIENGKVVSTGGSWEAGVDAAKAGIIMLGDPELGDRYRQEYYAGEAEDLGEVIRLDDSIQVPAGGFTDVLVTEDSTPLEPKLLERKYYARGVGVVLERSVRDPREVLRLIETTSV